MKSEKLTPEHIRRFFRCYPKEIASFLDANGISVNARDRHGRTLLAHTANEASDVVTRTKKLLSLGADPNIADKGGVTPLMLAVDTQSTRNCVSLLLAAGADVHAKCAEGQTALGICVNAGGGDEVMMTFFKLMTAGARDRGISFVDNPPSRYFAEAVDYVNRENVQLVKTEDTIKVFLDVVRTTSEARPSRAAPR